MDFEITYTEKQLLKKEYGTQKKKSFFLIFILNILSSMLDGAYVYAMIIVMKQKQWFKQSCSLERLDIILLRNQ